ncbi:MAG: hypothetical protein ACKO6B_03550 [Planctomycetia bacterium]
MKTVSTPPTQSASAAPVAREIVLPPQYRVLPTSVPFFVPGFEKQRYPQCYTFAPEPITCDAWFDRFAGRVLQGVGRAYLPVCRMSDGEFLLLFGHQPPSIRLRPMRRLRIWLSQARARLRERFVGFQAQTAPGVSSGAMTHAERRVFVPTLSERYLEIAEDGVLAMHLGYAPSPFQEHFFPAIRTWLERNAVTLTLDNYVPFYFVYGLLRGPMFPSLVGGRRVLIVHSATGDKREAITRSIQAANPRGIEWLTISPSRSFADRLDLSRLADQPDLCLLGGGVGKSALFPQLKPLGIPCIDAGFSFEVWADPEKQRDRPYMTPDDSFDPARVRFGTAAERRQMRA